MADFHSCRERARGGKSFGLQNESNIFKSDWNDDLAQVYWLDITNCANSGKMLNQSTVVELFSRGLFVTWITCPDQAV